MRFTLLIGTLLSLSMIACKKDSPVRTAKITSLKATAWPATDASGAPWDATTAPDIYFEILEADLSQVPNDPADDVVSLDASGVVNRTLFTPYRIADPNATYYIQLVDNDEIDADDEIGRVGFDLDDYPDQPAVIFRTQNGVSIEIGLQWEQ